MVVRKRKDLAGDIIEENARMVTNASLNTNVQFVDVMAMELIIAGKETINTEEMTNKTGIEIGKTREISMVTTDKGVKEAAAQLRWPLKVVASMA